MNRALENEIEAFGKEIFASLQKNSPGYFDARFYTEKLLSWGMEDEEFKISLFRFVDVLPSLPNAASVIRHVNEYFQEHRDRIPGLLRGVIDLRPGSLTASVLGNLIRDQVERMAHLFIVGATPQSALKPLRKMRRDGYAFTADLLGEACVSEVESKEYLDRYIELLDTLGKNMPGWKESEPIVPGHRGEEAPINISVKLSALYSQAKPLNTRRSVKILEERLGTILKKAVSLGAFVYVDMEDCSMTSITIDAFRNLLSSNEFKSYDRCGIVLQAYLRRTEKDLCDLIEWSKKRGARTAVRLVKGAYWDSESIVAKLNGWPVPVWQKKENSDANYEKLSRILLESSDTILPAFASHNVRSLSHAVKLAENMGVPNTDFEIQTLYGMGDPIKRAFAERGYLVREYSPIGELLPGMAYFVRRLLENTSNEGFLRLSFHDEEETGTLLRPPVFDPSDTGVEHCAITNQFEFRNIPLCDFSEAHERANLSKALDEMTAKLMTAPAIVRPFVAGEDVPVLQCISSVAPENATFQIARVELADENLARRAIDDLAGFFPAWRETSVHQRASLLRATASLMEERRTMFTAAIILEAGKPWAEADGDVAEAIDFLNYYALEAERILVTQHPGQMVGEDNSYFYEPRGVCAVIAPWNFPLAIPCGMFAAALVTGNTAVLKPAEQTSWIARLLFDCFLDAGLPARAAAFLPAVGEVVGPVLVKHPLVPTIVFTGSKNVGMEILRTGAESSDGSSHVKRVIAEMGGKNAIVIDDDADLDEAIKGILHSAFGYAGQKCSACSRAIAVGVTYDRLLERIGEAVKDVRLAPATDSSAFLGPVIDQDAYDRINRVIDEARTDCKFVIQGGEDFDASEGYFIPPTVVAGVPKGHKILTAEIFGPVLALVQADDFDSAIAMANDSEYGLTGGVFSRNPRNIDYARRNFRVGNLYLNRGCTGALVMRQPFGGAKMSGIGSKAGGPDYLLQFVIPRAVTENTLRRGFAPSAST